MREYGLHGGRDMGAGENCSRGDGGRSGESHVGEGCTGGEGVGHVGSVEVQAAGLGLGGGGICGVACGDCGSVRGGPRRRGRWEVGQARDVVRVSRFSRDDEAESRVLGFKSERPRGWRGAEQVSAPHSLWAGHERADERERQDRTGLVACEIDAHAEAGGAHLHYDAAGREEGVNGGGCDSSAGGGVCGGGCKAGAEVIDGGVGGGDGDGSSGGSGGAMRRMPNEKSTFESMIRRLPGGSYSMVHAKRLA
eukprot:6193093-Pleurochrysis_carterae.AAC.1